MPFECFRCGDCCRQLGYVHFIEKEYGDYRFLIRNTYTGERDTVTVDPDKRVLFDDRGIFADLPDACPFFRREPEQGLAACTIHLTRPSICREYGCWRILIISPRGFPAGKVRYLRDLVTDDQYLRKIWDECIAGLAEPDEGRWEEMMTRMLVRAGYSVRR